MVTGLGLWTKVHGRFRSGMVDGIFVVAETSRFFCFSYELHRQLRSPFTSPANLACIVAFSLSTMPGSELRAHGEIYVVGETPSSLFTKVQLQWHLDPGLS